jgi:hypothetical protein
MMRGLKLPVAVPFKEACPPLDASIAALLDRAIDHDPGARPTARELALALRTATERGG